ncbi:hypothetical protein TUMEXPCC7403_05825 [Tumidithrix helvetica PCC 7403]|uniref:hypothetical protein n=1 Tax=Tumidithrix helvetica TaxID=3457545 RepID=UPI003C83C6E4
MARYTQHFLIEILPTNLQAAVLAALEECNLSITYSTGDYVMAQENSGQVAYSKLVTVEVLIHQSEIKGEQVKLTCVTKNEELPLQVDNHCHRMAESVSQAFARAQSWKFLEAIPG